MLRAVIEIKPATARRGVALAVLGGTNGLTNRFDDFRGWKSVALRWQRQRRQAIDNPAHSYQYDPMLALCLSEELPACRSAKMYGYR
jgi:hypothetical protein